MSYFIETSKKALEFHGVSCLTSADGHRSSDAFPKTIPCNQQRSSFHAGRLSALRIWDTPRGVIAELELGTIGGVTRQATDRLSVSGNSHITRKPTNWPYKMICCRQKLCRNLRGEGLPFVGKRPQECLKKVSLTIFCIRSREPCEQMEDEVGAHFTSPNQRPLATDQVALPLGNRCCSGHRSKKLESTIKTSNFVVILKDQEEEDPHTITVYRYAAGAGF
jgi:hypothetical protein